MFLEFLEHHFLHLHMYRKLTGSSPVVNIFDLAMTRKLNQEVALSLTVVNRGSIKENAVLELFKSDRKDLQTRFEH